MSRFDMKNGKKINYSFDDESHSDKDDDDSEKEEYFEDLTKSMKQNIAANFVEETKEILRKKKMDADVEAEVKHSANETVKIESNIVESVVENEPIASSSYRLLIDGDSDEVIDFCGGFAFLPTMDLIGI